MTLKQKALLMTLGLLVGISTTAVVTNLIIIYTPAEVLLYAAGAAMAGFLLYMMYSLVLVRLEYEEKMKVISTNINAIVSSKI